jgi:hypothetical protein
MELEPIAWTPKPEPPRREGRLRSGIKLVLPEFRRVLGVDQIVNCAALIGDLAGRPKAALGVDHPAPFHDGRCLDVEAMAASHGICVGEIHDLMLNRRRQTARSVFCHLCGGGGFLALWLVEAFRTPAYTSVPYVLGLLALCSAFFLSAFYNALVNWQIRTLRLGTAAEFLRTDESWWPW